MPGDFVRYVGEIHANEFKSQKLTMGEVITRVAGTYNSYVVEFGDDAYVMPSTSIARAYPKRNESEPEVLVQKSRRRYFDAEEE